MANSQPSKESYVERNDFEGALERLNTTSPRWKKDWFTVCETIFKNCIEWAKHYVLNPVTKTIHKIFNVKDEKPKVRKTDIDFNADYVFPNLDDTSQKCYLIEFFNEAEESVASKVGTTIRGLVTRIREELNSKTYKNMGAVRCVVHRVYDCGEIPAEGLESRFRAEYIRKYPNSFCKNDRFIRQTFDLVEADKIAAAYLAA